MFSRSVRQNVIAGCILAATAGLPFAAQAQQQQDFATWLDGVRAEAAQRGLKTETIDSALSDLTPIPRVIELDRRQPEFTLTHADYMSRVVNAAKINKGRTRYKENEALLKEVAAKFGVQPRFIVALWGIETDYGRLRGGFNVVRALATLAHDGRRSSYFRKELFNALTIIDQGHITAKDMIGSWAGAMGQVQFMPSSFLNFSYDYDGDGKRNIWTSQADVFASAANYLSKVGWRDDQTWGRPVRLPQGFDKSLTGLEVTKGLNDWASLGVLRADGRVLPTRNLKSSIVLPGGEDGQAYVVYDNYRAILKWNRAHFFATAVGSLADRIAGG
jgi:membrane-bound lytic murein transglycosylase B